MEGLPARADIDVRCRRVTRRRNEIEPSIRRRDRHRIVGERALHRQDGIFDMDNSSVRDTDAAALPIAASNCHVYRLSSEPAHFTPLATSSI